MYVGTAQRVAASDHALLIWVVIRVRKLRHSDQMQGPALALVDLIALGHVAAGIVLRVLGARGMQGTDKDGCHMNKKAEARHCHQHL